ncbi:Epimerase family protein [Planctomycetes bacterium Pla163]|uniref:Epimerase family protein n=1 Tax=Rohdeia mirabilis TaxID=2528008 RepID=A0A518CX99_9BACT|nr:Epimerase family protein [Planctomycetes bacterium Pla163]
MSHATFQISSRFDASPQELFAWHGRPGALERLVPPFDPVRVLASEPAPDGNPIGDGARVLLRVGKGPFSMKWEALHSGYDPPHRFVDSQERGPFSAWRHEHVVQPEDESASRLVDTVNYRLPLHALSGPIVGGMVRRKLEATFRYRHATTIDDLRDHADARARLGHELPLRILVCGASGLVGRGLCALLTTGGHEVVRLVRREPRGADEIRWDPARGELDPEAVAAFDGVVNLSGANIAEGRWTDERKRVLAQSRTDSTATLVRALVDSGAAPRVYVQASAIGYYDDGGFERGETEPLDENAPRGEGFLPELCERWEAEAAPLEAVGVRTAFARFGVVLTPRGGALQKLLPPFLLGAGGPVGSGRQGLCWVAYDDALAALLFLLTSANASGPYNVVAPEPIVQRAFARELGSVLGRPAFLPLPGFAVSALFGEMGRTILLRGPLVVPRRLEDEGFRWRRPTLEGALRHLLGR